MVGVSDDYDADFGYMQHNGTDAWDCNVSAEFPHPPTYYFAIHLWAVDLSPTECQRQRIRWLKEQYTGLWPSLAQTIVDLHPGLSNSSQLDHAMREWVSVHLGEHHEDSLELVYDLNLPSEVNRGFFISITEAGIGKAFVAD